MSSRHNLSNNLLAFTVLLVIRVQVQAISVHYDEICANPTNRRMYVDLGKNGIIIASSASSSASVNAPNSHLDLENSLINQRSQKIDSYDQCRIELISCPGCIISVSFTFLNTSQTCQSDPILNTCTCDYVWIYEPPFEELSGRQFCGHYENPSANASLLFYKSRTRTVAITFVYAHAYQHAFTLHYSAERNRQIVQAFPEERLHKRTQIISTPFFPHPYSRDLNLELVIRCNESEACLIYLVFTDFLIAKTSVLEFFDWNGRRIDVATGLTFRPSVIISSGPSLSIRFYANGARSKGFKAEYSLILNDGSKAPHRKPQMDCGGLVDNLGGGISMMNVVKDGATQSYECVWIIQPSRNFLHLYTHLYLKVVAFSDFAETAELSIHQGSTSSDPSAEIHKFPFPRAIKLSQEHILPIFQGFYVRFTGIFGAKSELAVAYTAFNYHNECISGSDFLCKNQRCIPFYLQCDGFDHCGDCSDEPSSCFQGLKDRRWSHTSNFFFPKTDQYATLNAAAVVFIICCFGLISLIFALIILIFRITGRVRQQRRMEDHLQVIGDLLDQEMPSTVEILIEDDDPPVYEDPPNYDDVGKNKTTFTSNQRCSSRRSSDREDGARSKSNFKRSSSTCSRCSQRVKPTALQYVRMTPEEEEDSSIFDESSNAAGSQLANIPESPPPAYAFFLKTISATHLPEDQGPSGSNNFSPKTQSNTKNSPETKRNFFAKHFSNNDLETLKTKLLQKFNRSKKTKRDDNVPSGFCESNLSHWLSDSDISEKNSTDFEDPVASAKLQRSFSFDDL